MPRPVFRALLALSLIASATSCTEELTDATGPRPPLASRYVVVNEIESNGGTPGDWIELYNNGTEEVDLSGYVLRDNDDSHTYTFPEGSLLAGSSFLVVEGAEFGFDLGASDKVRFFAPSDLGVIGQYTWTTHAATTYARCPDITGEFRVVAAPTKGAANNCLVPTTTVRINEVESNGGTPGDWVELYNSGAAAVDLSGYVFRDSDTTHAYTLPAATSIPAGGYLLIEEAAFGFGLGQPDAARLYAPAGILFIDSISWTTHSPTTLGRCPSATGTFAINTTTTKGAANDCSVQVKINEVESNGGTPGDWVELYNAGPAPVTLTNYIFRDNDNTHAYKLPVTTIAAGGFVLLEEAAFGFGLGSADNARLFAPDSVTIVDSTSWAAHAAVTLARCPDGTGAFKATVSSTKGALNDCSVPLPSVKINEVESNLGTPGDWVELYNSGATSIDLSGYIFRDNDNSAAHAYAIPGGTILAAGGYYLLEEAAFNYGLGGADAARLYLPDSVTVVDSTAWAAHAASTYGRCPNGTGPFTTTAAPTKGAANNCAAIALSVKINEVESNGGTPGDWVEFINTGAGTADLSGYVFRDGDTTHKYLLPPGSTIAPGAFLVIEEAQFGFGLGGTDAATLLAPDTATIIDTYSWLAHATVTWGRCPDGTGGFIDVVVSTKGSANGCPGGVTWSPWSGDSSVTNVDPGANFFGGNMSGLAHIASGSAAPGILWASRNGPGAIFKLVWNGALWTPDTANGWSHGKLAKYTDGLGDADAEGIAIVGNSAYISAERNNGASGTSRNSILRYDLTVSDTILTAAMEWNLTAAIPATGANTGLEGVTFVPDAYLVARGFKNEATGAAYDSTTYANHGGGLFFVGIEETGAVHVFALDHSNGTFTKVASITTPFASVMDLAWDKEQQRLWVICDNGCNGRSVIIGVDTVAASPTKGQFIVTSRFERPTGMPNLNNEGFTVGAQAECVGGKKPAYWTDDGQTGGFSIRRGTVSCTAPAGTRRPVGVRTAGR